MAIISVNILIESELLKLLKVHAVKRPLKKSEGLFPQFEAPDLNEMREARAIYLSKIKAD